MHIDWQASCLYYKYTGSFTKSDLLNVSKEFVYESYGNLVDINGSQVINCQTNILNFILDS